MACLLWDRIVLAHRRTEIRKNAAVVAWRRESVSLRSYRAACKIVLVVHVRATRPPVSESKGNSGLLCTPNGKKRQIVRLLQTLPKAQEVLETFRD